MHLCHLQCMARFATETTAPIQLTRVQGGVAHVDDLTEANAHHLGFLSIKHVRHGVLYLQNKPLPHARLPEGHARGSFMAKSSACFPAGWNTPTWATS